MRKPEQLSGLPKVQLIILPIERKVIDAVAVAYALLELVPLLTADRRKGLARDGQKLREQLDNDLNYQEKSVV